MSFSKSNLTSSDFITSLTGTNGIATNYDAITSVSKLYYTTNSGGTWILAQSVSTSELGFIISLSSTGTPGSLNGIAAGYNINNYPIIYYTTNSGNTWSSSASGLPGLSTTEINNIYVSISGLSGVIAVKIENNDVLLYYSIDGGNNWNQSTNDSEIPSPALFNIPNAILKNAAICLDGSTVRYILTLINSSGEFDIYTSINGGENISKVLTLSDFMSESTSLSISGSIALLGGYNTISNNGYLYNSIDGGLSWLISINNITNTSFNSVSIDGIVGMAAALNKDDLTCYIYYTTNGTSWNTIQLSVTNVYSIVQIKVSGTIGYVALKTSLASLNSVYNTIDSGANWKLSINLYETNINDISVSSSNAIIGTDVGIYYNICSSTKCYSYENVRETSIFINYANPILYQYNRLVPDYFRKYYPECGFNSYREALIGTQEISKCLRTQLISSPIQLFSLEELYIRLVPSINDSPELVSFKDNIRNEFIAFCLNIEKSYLYFDRGKSTCNNNIVPWDAVYYMEIINEIYYTFTYAKNIPIKQNDQYIIYYLSINYYKFNNKINYNNIIRKILNLPINGEETVVNFYNMVYMSFVIMRQLFSISQTLLLGKDPGLPKQFLDYFFPFERQKYYYNYYLSWIQSRNRYLGFGDRINISNGDGTYISIPGKFTN
jgi:photosystem II stability/assembly factor-like uncharacterized protein